MYRTVKRKRRHRTSRERRQTDIIHHTLNVEMRGMSFPNRIAMIPSLRQQEPLCGDRQLSAICLTIIIKIQFRRRYAPCSNQKSMKMSAI